MKIVIEGGNGGTGLPQYGGRGGNGGHIVFKCNPQLDSLKNLKSNLAKLKAQRKSFKGKNGEDSFKYKLVGTNGGHFTIYCPAGCTFKNVDGGFLGEIDKEHDEIVMPIGGEGGRKENNYIGRLGVKMPVIIDLKLISDVGLVGYPNAGKSTLLKALTRAKPKIANIPFTTLTPNIGVIEYSDYRKISIADLPGLIKDAHLDVGLGHKFLKHILRTKLLLFVIAAEQFTTLERKDGYSPIEILLTLIKEIEMYDDTILNKPAILLLSKFDKRFAKNIYDKFLDDLERIKKSDFSTIRLSRNHIPNRLISFDFVLPVSSKTSWNINGLQKKLRDQIDNHFEHYLRSKGRVQTFVESVEKENNNLKKKKKEDELAII